MGLSISDIMAVIESIISLQKAKYDNAYCIAKALNCGEKLIPKILL